MAGTNTGIKTGITRIQIGDRVKIVRGSHDWAGHIGFVIGLDPDINSVDPFFRVIVAEGSIPTCVLFWKSEIVRE